MLYKGKHVSYPGDERLIEDITFTPGMRNTYARPESEPIIGHALHWTGGEGSLSTLKGVLKKRGCSITFAVPDDDSGNAYQLADLATRCAHIGKWNPGRLGTEVTCRGFASKEDWLKASKADPSLRARAELDWAAKRDVYTDKIAGRPVNMAAFNPKQVDAVVWLCNATSAICGFERRIPFIEATKTMLDQPTPLGDLMMGDIAVTFEGKKYLPRFTRDPRPRGTMKNVPGVIGHFHVHPTKYDPGTQIMYRLWADGYNPAKLTIKI